jgi:hypothetical protein
MGNFKRLGNFEDQTGGKKEASLVGEAAYILPVQKVFFGPAINVLIQHSGLS